VGVSQDLLLTMMIVKDAQDTTFMVLNGVKPGLPPDPKHFTLSVDVVLDRELNKGLPYVCMSCHGGNFNSTTRKVEGASFLPLDPELLAFASPADQLTEEEHFRRINQQIIASEPVGSPVAKYINGLYNNTPSLTGSVAQPDYVPTAWQSEAALYRSVVRPYCTSCHLTVKPAYLHFDTAADFLLAKCNISKAVFQQHSMPHSQRQFEAFWTKIIGPTYVPDILEAALGPNPCN
jgi:hypothetical protein